MVQCTVISVEYDLDQLVFKLDIAGTVVFWSYFDYADDFTSASLQSVHDQLLGRAWYDALDSDAKASLQQIIHQILINPTA